MTTIDKEHLQLQKLWALPEVFALAYLQTQGNEPAAMESTNGPLS